MLGNDYRYTIYEKKGNVPRDFTKIFSLFKARRITTENHYKWIKKKNAPFKKIFLNIYDNRCVYCGNTIDNIHIDLFEIDHYKNKASFENESEAGDIINLYPSCQACNRGKSGIEIKGEYLKILDPNNNIYNVFFRDDDYSICIKDEYKTDDFIKKFYDDVHLGNQTKRIDYLLKVMNDISNKLPESVKAEMTSAYVMLSKKRHQYTS